MNIEERFLRYVLFPTMSDENSSTCPSTAKQLVLAEYLAGELASIGLSNVTLDENGYVYGRIPGNAPSEAVVGFISHMDTSDAAPDSEIHPTILEYTGGDIVLNEELGIVLSPRDYPSLNKHIGETLIVTDGTTLLGADDKAGIAAIVTAAERLIANEVPHGDIMVAFTPDEEIGRGADRFNIGLFGADYAYTVDGGAADEIEYENFNAAAAEVVIKGISVHPGSAKNAMINAARIAAEFQGMLPADEIPEKTEGYEGFYHLIHMEGSCEHAVLKYILRDHNADKLEVKKRRITEIAQTLNAKYGDGIVTAKVKDSYRNMRELIERRPEVIEHAEQAIREAGLTPRSNPVRGGTDGAVLTYKGLLCPNLGTGGENFHSRFEYCSVDEMKKVTDIIVNIARGLTETEEDAEF